MYVDKWKNKDIDYFAMSLLEFAPPSTVKGEHPVRSSNAITPIDHQSTTCNYKFPCNG